MGSRGQVGPQEREELGAEMANEPRDITHVTVTIPPKMLWSTSPSSEQLECHSATSPINRPQTLSGTRNEENEV